MKKLLIAICAVAMLAACHKDETEENQVKADRTVLVYISGECSLWDFINDDLYEMKLGSPSIGDNNLLVYVDNATDGEIPWLARINKGQITDSVSFTDIAKLMNLNPAESFVKGDPYSSEAQVMEGVLRYAFQKFPSRNNDYGLVLWGHGSGWLIKDSLSYTAMARQKAYGIDNGKNDKQSSNNGKWLNIPSMAKLLSKLPHLTFILCDCCNMMCLEIAYELRNVTDYLIGTPSEIPGLGAPYNTVVPAMFEAKTTLWKSIVDRYHEQCPVIGYDLPLSVIKTSEMENLASATKTVLKSSASKFGEGYPDMSGLIYYYYDTNNHQEFYDANDFVLKYADAEDYSIWKKAFDKAVVYKIFAESWMIDKNKGDFPYYWNVYYGKYYTITEEKFGGVSMYVPTYIQRFTDNIYIEDMQWYKAAGYDEIGWHEQR
jgi:hypothetical protein